MRTLGLILLGSSLVYLAVDAMLVFFTFRRHHDRPWHLWMLIACVVGAAMTLVGMIIER